MQGDADDAIAALRVGDAQRIDPAGLRHIEALARRAAAHQGDARRLLDQRLAQLIGARQRKLQAAAPPAATPPPWARRRPAPWPACWRTSAGRTWRAAS